MKVEIRARKIEVDAELRVYVDRRLRFALGRERPGTAGLPWVGVTGRWS